jgi:hypothetical protein
MLTGRMNSHQITGKIPTSPLRIKLLISDHSPIFFRKLLYGHSLGESHHGYDSHLATMILRHWRTSIILSNHYSSGFALFHTQEIATILNGLGLVFFKRLSGSIGFFLRNYGWLYKFSYAGLRSFKIQSINYRPQIGMR